MPVLSELRKQPGQGGRCEIAFVRLGLASQRPMPRPVVHANLAMDRSRLYGEANLAGPRLISKRILVTNQRLTKALLP